jgi:septum site-determining protein MinC
MRETVVFKGYRGGLELVIDESADFGAILLQLKRKLDSAANFFTLGAVVKIPAVTHVFTDNQKQQIYSLLADYGLTLTEAVPVAAEVVRNYSVASCFPVLESHETNAFIVKRTLRSGQTVKHTGTIIIIGDVNPGAEVVAGGDVIIFGICRGVVHAGSNGDEQATITANRLQAMQIRIAGMIARAPDDGVAQPNCVERARIVEGQVIIEPANK